MYADGACRSLGVGQGRLIVAAGESEWADLGIATAAARAPEVRPDDSVRVSRHTHVDVVAFVIATAAAQQPDLAPFFARDPPAQRTLNRGQARVGAATVGAPEQTTKPSPSTPGSTPSAGPTPYSYGAMTKATSFMSCVSVQRAVCLSKAAGPPSTGSQQSERARSLSF